MNLAWLACLLSVTGVCTANTMVRGADCPVDYCVEIDGINYIPNQLSVFVGETVRFAYSGEHPFRQVRSATGTTAYTPDPLLCDNMTVTRPNCEMTFTTPGEFFYICVAHAFMDMRGSVTVLDPMILADSFE